MHTIFTLFKREYRAAVRTKSFIFPGIIPVILPMFILVPVIQDPSGPLATTMSGIQDSPIDTGTETHHWEPV